MSIEDALAFAEAGYPVFSVWGIDKGVCRCPKGKDCTSPGKHPIPREGFKAGTTNPDAITKMLSAPGSGGNYGVGPVDGVIYLDPDTPDWVQKVKELNLPPTFMVLTGNGAHLYYGWPAEYGPVPSTLFGWVVRSKDHEGYVVGPGSAHANGKTYRIAKQNGHSTFDMLGTVADFPRELVPTENIRSSITVTGPKQPEQVGVGGRHDYLRDTARFLRGRGLTGEALFTAVDAVNQKLPEPKSAEAVRRAIGDVETRFAPDPEPMEAIEQVIEALTVSPFIQLVADYRLSQPQNIEWVSPLAAYGYVSLIAGPPKSGKSTLVGNLLRAREDNAVFLWGDPVPDGPTILVTEESGFAVVRKTEGLSKLHILDRRSFALAGLTKLDHLLAALTAWNGDSPALMVIDTLAVWGDIKDENDAVAATRAVARITLLAQTTGAAIVLIHHSRKGGGEHGEGIRGSGAIFATVDQSIELSFGLDPLSDDRMLTVAGRLTYGESNRLTFDRTTMRYALDTAPVIDQFPLDDFPMDGGTEQGFTREDAEKTWDLGASQANRKLKQLVSQKRLVVRTVKLPGERAARNVYWKSRPLLVVDNRSTGQEMADIFATPDGVADDDA